MSEVTAAQHELIEEFSLFEDWMSRYQYVIDLGRRLPAFPDKWKTEENRIHGCQSQVWMHAECRDGRLYFQATSDSAIVCGLIALLMRVYSGREAREIVESTPHFIQAIGLDTHLSPTRSNGLRAMLDRVRATAAGMLAT